jgi:SAM-dependent methyltransferase
MTELPFKNKFDFIFSAFDSINYLHTNIQLNSFFSNISTNLSDKGYFIFDVSLKNNSMKNLKKLNRKGKFKGISYVQKSEFDESSLLHKNTLIIDTKEGKTFKEIHIQKIYDFYYYFEIFENKDIYVYDCFEAFTFNEGTPESDRVQFIVKRKS